jgi:hypothetical protein
MPSWHGEQQLCLFYLFLFIIIIQSYDAVHFALLRALLNKLRNAWEDRMSAWFLLKSVEMSKIILAAYPSNQILTSTFGSTETVYV